jgi:hypothetical protein
MLTAIAMCRLHHRAMDTKTKLIVAGLTFITLLFIVVSGLLAFTGPPTN